LAFPWEYLIGKWCSRDPFPPASRAKLLTPSPKVIYIDFAIAPGEGPQAEVAELADAPGSGPGSRLGSGGSSPLFGILFAKLTAKDAVDFKP
jgi:hypothetical protein